MIDIFIKNISTYIDKIREINNLSSDVIIKKSTELSDNTTFGMNGVYIVNIIISDDYPYKFIKYIINNNLLYTLKSKFIEIYDDNNNVIFDINIKDTNIILKLSYNLSSDINVNTINYLKELPYELSYNIVKFLNYDNIVKLCNIEELSNICEDWKYIYSIKYPKLFNITNIIMFKNTYKLNYELLVKELDHYNNIELDKDLNNIDISENDLYIPKNIFDTDNDITKLKNFLNIMVKNGISEIVKLLVHTYNKYYNNFFDMNNIKLTEYINIAISNGYLEIFKFIKQNFKSVNLLWFDKSNIIKLLENGYVEKVKYLINNGILDILYLNNNNKIKKLNRILEISSNKGYNDIIDIIYNYYVNTDSDIFYNWHEILVISILNNSLYMVKLILDNELFRNYTREEFKNFLYLSENKNYEITQLLNEYDLYKFSDLLYIIEINDDMENAEIIYEKGFRLPNNFYTKEYINNISNIINNLSLYKQNLVYDSLLIDAINNRSEKYVDSLISISNLYHTNKNLNIFRYILDKAQERKFNNIIEKLHDMLLYNINIDMIKYSIINNYEDILNIIILDNGNKLYLNNNLKNYTIQYLMKLAFDHEYVYENTHNNISEILINIAITNNIIDIDKIFKDSILNNDIEYAELIAYIINAKYNENKYIKIINDLDL